MNLELLTERTEALHKDLASLYQTASVLPWISPELLPQALQELVSSARMAQLAMEELRLQNEELIQTQNLLEAEREKYQNLFDLAPDSYLVTNAEGVIQQANEAAAKLLNISKQFLLGKAIINFVPLQERQHFRTQLNQLSYSDTTQELVVCLQQRHGESWNAALTVKVIRNQQGKPKSLYWLVRKIIEQEQTKPITIQSESDITQGRPVHKYSKGEDICLDSQVIWCVHQGVVKLSTFGETGEEVLIGLAKTGMVFGSSMTGLDVYQATALCDVEVVSFDQAEIAASLTLNHSLLQKINQRLQQTECLLANCGKLHVQERLHSLLQLLQQEIGEPVPQGTRLSVRLTHEDIASACCTTRVTITRLMGRLEKLGLISFDGKNHIILKNTLAI
ncbi:helix-turn-helix domain-containing protein [Anabaena azotica]|uniref:Helix-turn-helix domain-containing protein n=1 Tax=Anabaena azotica FACHB-119 TaxID=947527 RepID=A0ABR8DAT0_9NOST|nr:helix-turn-helix domain-containing protein [Anabaena azotica]MBD2504303.1 helix-turn-helix domain-containing protein [Anabaena azotica FACHB-119]